MTKVGEDWWLRRKDPSCLLQDWWEVVELICVVPFMMSCWEDLTVEDLTVEGETGRKICSRWEKSPVRLCDVDPVCVEGDEETDEGCDDERRSRCSCWWWNRWWWVYLVVRTASLSWKMKMMLYVHNDDVFVENNDVVTSTNADHLQMPPATWRWWTFWLSRRIT